MRSEVEIQERILELKELCFDEDDEFWGDEGEWSELMTLYWVLGEDV